MNRPQKLDALTSLRFFAAAMIVIGHADHIFGSLGIASAAPLNQGVAFFFVLSGFILAYNYPSFANKQEIQRFFIARFARIWPLHVTTCFLWIFLIFHFDRKSYFPGAGGLLRLVSNLLLVQAWIPLHDWALSFNGVAWSISAEFFFYLAFPLLITLWGRYWHWTIAALATVIIAILVVAQQLRLPGEDAYLGVGLLGMVYFNPLVRIFEFAIGIAVARFVRQRHGIASTWTPAQWLVIEIGAILAIVVALVAAANFSGIQQSLGNAAAYYFAHEGLWLFWALLIAVFALSRGPICKLLSLRIFVFLGEISFALYLIHALVINYLDPYADKLSAFGMLGYALFWLLCLTLAALLFLGVEQPFRKKILFWWESRQSAERNISAPSYGRSSTASFVLLTLISISLSIFRPSLISAMDASAVNAFLSSSGVIKVGDEATFNNGIAVLAVRVAEQSVDTLNVAVLLRNQKDAKIDSVLALHLNDAQGRIIDKPGDVLLDKSSSRLPAGTSWLQSFSINRNAYEKTSSFGIAMYRNPATLFDISGGNRDWGGRRLIILK
ncbi:acyltransferase [Herminiimonas sp. CN]|uniref:acyltransferase family protein n=1 Tax=Herminiimonas sp. CN TaxID=1349818 RepID=UPI00047335CF|nr:acyltransferase [Herminiimonas sp. CN]